MNRIFAAASVLGLFSVACSQTKYRYIPAEKQTAGQNQTEAIYSSPAGHSGTVRIQSMGIVKLKPKGRQDEIAVLQIRMSVSNQTPSQEIWLLDAQAQSVSFQNEKGRTPPVAVNSDHDGLPRIQIASGELRSLDLYFPLPKADAEAKDIPEFDFNWSISAASTKVARSTPFTRQQLPESTVVVYPSYGYYSSRYYAIGPYWWYGSGLRG